MQMGLDGNVAVVTGGASGIGWACARMLARHGSRISLWNISEKNQRHGCGTLPVKVGGPSHGVIVGDQAAVESALGETETALRPVSHLVHAAAIGSGRFGISVHQPPTKRLAEWVEHQCDGNGSCCTRCCTGHGRAKKRSIGVVERCEIDSMPCANCLDLLDPLGSEIQNQKPDLDVTPFLLSSVRLSMT